MSRRVTILLVAASMAVLMLVVAGPAQATDSNAYVVVRDRVCGDPSLHVRAISGVESPTGWRPNGYDYGDNIIYPRVRLYQTNSFHAAVLCYKAYPILGWIKIGVPREVWGSFRPTAPKQTFWIG